MENGVFCDGTIQYNTTGTKLDITVDTQHEA
jgi:hypothetical protein